MEEDFGGGQGLRAVGPREEEEEEEEEEESYSINWAETPHVITLVPSQL